MFALLALFLVAAGPVRNAADYRTPVVGGPMLSDRATLQAALDDSRLINPPGIVVHVPPGLYTLDGPVYLPTQARLVGAGRDATILQGSGGYEGPLLVVGVDRRPKGVPLSLDHLPDSFGRLDLSAAPMPGRRYGIKTLNDSHVGSLGGPFSQGPRQTTGYPKFWGDVSRVTWEWVVDQDPNSGAAFHQGPQFGMMDSGRPGPWCFYTAGNDNGCWVGTFQLLQGGKESTVSCVFAAPTGPGVHRLTFQLDTTARTAQAYVNGNQVAFSQPIRWPADLSMPLTLAPCRNNPFMLGAAGRATNVHGSDYIGGDGNFDRCYLGLHALTALRYADDGPGKPQRRLDGKPINDANRYFISEPSTVAFLPCDRDPSAVVLDRCLKVKGTRNVDCPAFFLSRGHYDTYANQPWCGVEGLTVRGIGGSPYGVSLYIGLTSAFRARDCAFYGGAYGVVADWGNSYVLRFDGCNISGWDAAIYTIGAMTEVRSCDFPFHGRTTINATGKDLTVRDSTFGNGGNPENVFKLNGVNAILDSVNIDIENSGIPSDAVVLSTASTQGEMSGGSLDVRRFGYGAGNPNAPLFRLAQNGASLPASLVLNGLTDHQEHPGGVVRVEGSAWSGTISHANPYRFTPAISYGAGVASGSFVLAPGTPNYQPPVSPTPTAPPAPGP